MYKSFIIENFSLHCLVKYIFYGCISVFFNSTIYQECGFCSLGNWPVWWYWTVCCNGKPGNDAGLILKLMLWIGPHICRLQYSYLYIFFLSFFFLRGGGGISKWPSSVELFAVCVKEVFSHGTKKVFEIFAFNLESLNQSDVVTWRAW